MNSLELWRLKRHCDKYGIDYYEIDNTLTYAENKKHLLFLARNIAYDVFELERYVELQHEFMENHFLEYYLLCQMDGETISKEVAPSTEPHFSLQKWIDSHGGNNKTLQNVTA